MNKNGYALSIENPCREDWQNMTAHNDGKMCAQCCKQVHDFTGMSDVEILAIITNKPTKVCGRFESHQVGRLMQPTIAPSGYFVRRGLFSSLFMISAAGAVLAQEDASVRVCQEQAASPQPPVTNIAAASNVLRGRILIQENNEPLAFAEIHIQYMQTPVIADADGNFRCEIPNLLMQHDSIRFEVSSVGFGMKNFTIGLNQLSDNYQIFLMDEYLMGDISVTVVKRRWWQFWKWRS